MFSSIKAKLIAMLLGVVLSLSMVGWVSWHNLLEGNRAMEVLANNQMPSAIALGRLAAAMARMELWTGTALSEAPARFQNGSTSRRHRDLAVAELDQAAAAFAALPMRLEESAAWRDYTSKATLLKVQDDLVWAALAEGNQALARERYAARVAQGLEALEAAGRVLGLQGDIARLVRTEAENDRRGWYLMLGTALAAALVTLAALGAALLRSIRVNANLLNTSAQAMVLGEFGRDLETGLPDEFAPVHAAFGRSFAALRQVAAAADTLAAGDLEVEIASQGPSDLLAASLRRLVATLKEASRQANVIAGGDYEADINPRGAKDELGIALQRMTRALRAAAAEARESGWLRSGVARINEIVLGQEDPQVLANLSLSSVAEHADGKVGALYFMTEDAEGPFLALAGSYAYTERKHLGTRFRLGEGLVGQAALERKQIVLQNAPWDYVKVVSGVGESLPRNICVTPILFKGEVRGVLELGTLAPLTRVQQQYLEQVTTIIGVSLEIARNREMVQRQQVELQASNSELQVQTRELESAGEELKRQQVELQQANAELETQMQRTQESEARLKVQQRELESTNAELETRNTDLERQKREIEKARTDLAVQAEQLSVASKYKSEFLANMSHELRTPLNSLLLLARSLRDDSQGNLDEDQRQSASVIYDSGNDLLNLINDILDLSKIEAGRMELRLESVEVADIARNLTLQFEHMARTQGLDFSVDIAPDAPGRLVTDPNRLGQVLKNLLGNAIKFTDAGSVGLTFTRPGAESNLSRSGLRPENAIALRITDTGIGIAHDKQLMVFEAFQQADGGDRRKYGGTGLGLSISREIVTLLGGEIQLESRPGEGSTFTVVIPVESRPTARPDAAPAPKPAPRPAAPEPEPRPKVEPRPAGAPRVADDRESLREYDRSILIVEDDARFSAVLVAEVRKRGFKALAALDGERGLALAKEFRPTGIILDLNLPGMDGWEVLKALKQDVDTRHIPVHIASVEEASLDELRAGAIGHAIKPMSAEDIGRVLAAIEGATPTAEKHVLVVEDDPVVRRETVRIIGNGNVHAEEVATGVDALQALAARRFDLVVLDLELPDMQGLDLLKAASAGSAPLPPVIVYTVREVTQAEEMALRHYAESIIIKDVRSQDRLIDEVALFLHRVVSDLPEDKKQAIRHLHESDKPLRGRKILIVEDDMRTMFAMAKLLAGHGVDPVKATNGEEALALLEAQPDVDLVLLDMMMPVMDGYETARRLRQQPRFAALPVIALTAKAMKEDRQKCIDAGATDYLAKPVDPDRLVSLLRVWLSR